MVHEPAVIVERSVLPVPEEGGLWLFAGRRLSRGLIILPGVA